MEFVAFHIPFFPSAVKFNASLNMNTMARKNIILV